MEKNESFDFTFDNVFWKCIEFETTIQELTSLLRGDSSVIDYDGRGPDDYTTFKNHINDIVSRDAEDKIVKSVGLSVALQVRATDPQKFNSLLEMVAREHKRKSIHIVLLRRDGFDKLFGKNTPYVRVAVANELESRIGALVRQNWNSKIDSKQKGFKLFDVFMKVFDGDIDLSYIANLQQIGD